MTKSIKWLGVFPLVACLTTGFMLKASAITFTTGCADPDFCTLSELESGGGIQIGDKLATNWSITENDGFNLDNLEIGSHPSLEDTFSLFSRENELFRAGNQYNDAVAYAFKLTSLETNITSVDGDLQFRSVSTRPGGNPQGLGTIGVGTSSGSSNLGSTTDIFGLVENPGPNPPPIDVPNLNQVFVSNEIVLRNNTSIDGFVQLGNVSGQEGPAFNNRIQSEPVPFEAEGTMGLVALGGYLGYRHLKRKYAKKA